MRAAHFVMPMARAFAHRLNGFSTEFGTERDFEKSFNEILQEPQEAEAFVRVRTSSTDLRPNSLMAEHDSALFHTITAADFRRVG